MAFIASGRTIAGFFIRGCMVAVDMFALLLGCSSYFVEYPGFDVDGAVATSSGAFSLSH
jgi:hypothetical protein